MRRGAALESAKAVCVLAHGRGQSPEWMEEHVLRRLAAPDVAFALPRAAGGSWYQARAIDPLTARTRAELAASLDQLRALIGSLPALPLVLAGFSQGGCLALEYAMRQGPWRGALAVLTGCRVGVRADDRPMAGLAGLPVYITGSNSDPWIPVSAFADAAEALADAGASLRAESFPGRAHEVCDAEIDVLTQMINVASQAR